jgi:hypothetical protein
MPGNKCPDPVRETEEITDEELSEEEFMIPPTRDSAWIVEKDESGNYLPACHIIHVHSGTLEPGRTGGEKKPGMHRNDEHSRDNAGRVPEREVGDVRK